MRGGPTVPTIGGNVNGKVTIVASTAQDFVIDVSGYFTNPTAANLGLGVHNTTPARLVDSAVPTGPCIGAACGPLMTSTRQKVQVSGNGNIPASATGVIGVLTVGAGSTADGFVRINPNLTSGVGVAGDETINYTAGQTRNAVVFVPLKTDGTIEIVASNNAGNWTLDVAGYLTQPASTWKYRYDAAGTRQAKTAPDGTDTTFTYSSAPGLPMLLTQTTGASTTALIYGPGDQPIEQVNPDSTTWYYHWDQLGSIRLTTTITNGSTVASRNFNAYGSTKTQTGNQPLLGYNGQYLDAETGFIYARASD